MAKGSKELRRRKRDKKEGRQMLYAAIGITFLLVVIIYFMSRGNF